VKRARDILALQRPDGSWGQFHTMAIPTALPTANHPLATEQALRHLHILGFTAEDEAVQRAIAYMEYHLAQPESVIFFEKKHDPKIFTDLMLSAWLRLFVPDHPGAMRVAKQWAAIIEAAFADGSYNHERYAKSFAQQLGKTLNPKAGVFVNFVTFYQIALLQGMLTPETESAMLDYAISYPNGLGYICRTPLNQPPEEFSRKASHYLAAIELIAGYALAPQKLGIAKDWLLQHQLPDGQWDFGPKANDGVYFPLCDSWRKAEDRRRDCTVRVTKLLKNL